MPDFALKEQADLGRSLSRILVIDGRCLCKNNGIGNLFGDYVVWFTVAALSNRALFMDWTDSAPRDNEQAMSKNWTVCLESGKGYACPRVPRRFDLSSHFSAAGGRIWRWTARARKAAQAVHGAAAESVIISRLRTDPVRCDAIVDRLLGPSPWLTVRVSDDTATAMLPHCLGIRTPRGKTGGGGKMSGMGPRTFPDRSSVSRMLLAFSGRLGDAGHTRASAEVARAAELHGGHGRRVDSALWRAPLLVPRASPLLRSLAKSSSVRSQSRSRVVEVVAAYNAAINTSSSLSPADGPTGDPRSQRQVSEVPTLGLLASCVMHAMLRPRQALAAHLRPLLSRVGGSSVVTLQIRSGWADDSLYLGSKLATLLSSPPTDLLRELTATPRYDYLHLLEPRRQPDAARDGPAVVPGVAAAPREWLKAIQPTLDDSDEAKLVASRWAALTSTPCMADTRAAPPLRDSPCLDPSPAYLDARARRFLGRRPSYDAILSWRPAVAAKAFRNSVPAPVDLPGATTSRFAQVIRCAAHTAQAIAHERRLGDETDINSSLVRHGGSHRSWLLYVSSDSPGLRSLLERLPALRGHVIGCFPRACSDVAHRAGQWRTPTADEQLALATDVWMMGAADHTLSASATTLVYWTARAPGHDGRPQLLNLLQTSPRHAITTPASPSLGNKMVPICPNVPGVGKPGKCVDAEPNYERFPQHVIRPKPLPGLQDECFAKRFALMSESAAVALERATRPKSS